MSDQEAYDKAFEIHTKGSAVVYRGAKTHCHKIGDALSKINVTYIIEN
jgi:ATP-dependent Clp protease adapter protein ClpS